MPFAQVMPLAKKTDQHGCQKTVHNSHMSAFFHHIGMVGTAEQEGDAPQDEHEHGPRDGLAFESSGFQNKLINFLFIGGNVFGGIVKEFIQVVAVLKASINIFGQSGHADKVKHDKGLGENGIDEGDQSILDVLPSGRSGKPSQSYKSGRTDGNYHEQDETAEKINHNYLSIIFKRVIETYDNFWKKERVAGEEKTFGKPRDRGGGGSFGHYFGGGFGGGGRHSNARFRSIL